MIFSLKKNLCLLSLSISTILVSQEKDDIEKKFLNRIKMVESTKKLILMDSLSDYIAFETEFSSDSIIRKTIALAKKLDSFDIVIKQTSNLLNYLNYKEGKYEEAKELFQKTRKLIPKLKSKKGLSKFYFEIADIHHYSGDYEKSLQYYDTAYFYANKFKDRFKGLSKLGKGMVYTDKGDFGNASLTMQEAIQIFKKQNDTIKWLDTKNSMAILYSKNGFLEQAKKERDEIAVLSSKIKSYPNLPANFYNNAITSKKLGLKKDQIKYLRLSLLANKTSVHKDFFEPILKLGLASAYAENDSIAISDKLMNEIEPTLDIEKNSFLKSFYLEAKMRIAFEKKKFKEAILMGEEYLAMKYEEKNYDEIQSTEKFLYKVYNAINEKEKALKHYEKYTKIKDSISNIQNISVLAYYQTLYETEKRDLIIKAQETSIELLDSKNEQKKYWLFLGGISLILLFVFAMAVKSRNYLKKKQILLKKFTKDMIAVQENERSRIAKELHDSLGQRLLILKSNISQKEDAQKNELVMISEAIDEVRNISHNLHPFQFEKLGLVNSLKNLIDDFQKSSSIFYSHKMESISKKLSIEKQLFIFRMIQECLVNVEKHSKATACNVTVIEDEKWLEFIIRDNGKGFTIHEDVYKKGIGLKNLKDRASFLNASLQIQSEINKGTITSIKL